MNKSNEKSKPKKPTVDAATKLLTQKFGAENVAIK